METSTGILLYDSAGGRAPFILRLKKTYDTAITVAICREDGLRELGPPWITAISLKSLKACAEGEGAEIFGGHWRVSSAGEKVSILIAAPYMTWEVVAKQRDFRAHLNTVGK